MATKDRVTIELYVDDQGTVKIRNATVATQELAAASVSGSQASMGGAEDFAASLVKQIGIYALVTAAAYKLEQTVVGAFKAGIQSVDDFQLTTIGVAATLTDLGLAGADSQKDYARNIAYSKDMYGELELAAAKHFASGKDMVQAWNILSQKGIVLRKEEIDDLGTIVDKIKLATQGQVQAIQISQELRAMLSGQARATDQLAMMVKDRYGAAWKDVVEQHRQDGDLIHWLAQEFKGLIYAGEDVQKTITSQKTTLDTLLSQVGRGGLAGAYNDIVGIIRDMNSYLREHRGEIEGGITRGWQAVKELVQGTWGFVKEIANIANKGIVVPITFSFGGLSKWMASDPGVQALSQGYYGGVLPNMPEAPKYSTPAQTAALRAVSGGQIVQTPEGPITMYGQETVTPAPTRKMGSAEEKGGKGRDTTETLENLILQLRQEEAKLSEGAFAGVDAWYVKITEKIKKLAMDDQQLKDGMLAASELKAGKEQKISDDLNKKFLAATHQTSALQITEDLKRISDVKGHVKEEDQAREIMYQHAVDRSQKLALAENQQQKTYYDSLAQSSILIKDQVIWKEQSWQLEKKISQAQLEQWFIGKDLTASQKDNYRAMLGLTNAAKEYNLTRQKAVDLGTLEGWAIERAGEALKREKTTIKDALTGMEGFFTDAFSQGIQGALSGQKKSFKEVGATIVQSMVLKLNEKSFTKIWDNIAKMIAPPAKSTTGSLTGGAGVGGAQDPGQELSLAAKLLSTSGLQLGLSAGGLLLSGIGIATNSQALVYAGAVLQMVGLAIQVIEMLTATTTTIEFTAAAIALTGSAAALGIAATALTMAAMTSTVKSFIPFLHTGGLVAHGGLLVAHGGLNMDERLIKAQVGEWIINRDTTAEYARHGISFDMLNSGRLPVAGLPVAAGDAGGNAGGTPIIQHHTTTHITVVTPDGKVISKQTKREIVNLMKDKDVRREIGLRVH
ncbi:MAG: hypothetical protein D4R73_02935 [Deltaproteobacteria bacterium]|nr:MAG: hypothetical protein D4R73_02935 [Deltaproteobacteria bacterium]